MTPGESISAEQVPIPNPIGEEATSIPAETPKPAAEPSSGNAPPAPPADSAAIVPPITEESLSPKAEIADPAKQDEPASGVPALSTEEQARRFKVRQAGRETVLTLLIRGQRPKPATATAAVESYLAIIKEMPEASGEEWEQLRAGWTERSAAFLAEDRAVWEKCEAAWQRNRAGYNAIFEALSPLEQSLAQEVDNLRDDDPAMQQAPVELRDVLLNYKKGIEIIQRMVKRLHDRRKPLDAVPPPLTESPELQQALPADAQWQELLTSTTQCFHDWRAAQVNTIRDAQKVADSVVREAQQIVKNLIGALDGIESGRASEPGLLASTQAHRPQHEGLIDAWVLAYPRLEECLPAFFQAANLQQLTVEPGTLFQPDAMEPGGTVADPQRRNEEVASILRCGYAFQGEQIRPILVEVVMNPSSTAKE